MIITRSVQKRHMIEPFPLSDAPEGAEIFPPTIRREPRANALRAGAFRIIKAPLLARYAVRWHWPRDVDFGDWQRVSFRSRRTIIHYLSSLLLRAPF